MMVAIAAGDSPVGVMGIYSRTVRAFTENEVHFLEAVANVIGLAMERQRLEKDLRNRAAELADADRRKDEFLATLAHELRNPLAPIYNAANILRLKCPRQPDLLMAQQIIERQVQQMSRLVDDLLDVSRISRGKLVLRRERVELASVVGSAVETSRPRIEQKVQKLTVTLPPDPIYLDADLTR